MARPQRKKAPLTDAQRVELAERDRAAATAIDFDRAIRRPLEGARLALDTHLDAVEAAGGYDDEQEELWRTTLALEHHVRGVTEAHENLQQWEAARWRHRSDPRQLGKEYIGFKRAQLSSSPQEIALIWLGARRASSEADEHIPRAVSAVAHWISRDPEYRIRRARADQELPELAIARTIASSDPVHRARTRAVALNASTIAIARSPGQALAWALAETGRAREAQRTLDGHEEPDPIFWSSAWLGRPVDAEGERLLRAAVKDHRGTRRSADVIARLVVTALVGVSEDHIKRLFGLKR